jgi:predicted PurR-regulated permease PerM
MDKDQLIPWYYNKFFKYLVEIVLILTGTFLVYQLFFLVHPILNFIYSVFPPIIISFLIYYLFRPIVYTLESLHIPRVLSIMAIYLISACFLVIFFIYIAPFLANQVTAIANTSVQALERIQQGDKTISFGSYTIDWQYEIGQRLVGALKDITIALSRNLVDFLGILTRITTILVVIPFIVYYLLKEDSDFSSKFSESFPANFRGEVKNIVRDVDSTLSKYITGLMIIALSVGIMLFFVYLFIGLKYALILSLIAVIFTSIPFLGPFLAVTPALLVGFADSPVMAFKVLIGFVIVQQIESNIISPQVIGQRLNIHPLTVILLLLAAGTLYGLLGLIFVTPLYALMKVIFGSLYKIYMLRHPKIKASLSMP